MLSTRCLPRNEVFFLKRFSGVHIFRKLGLQLLDQPIAAFQADKYKKHYKTSSEILTIVNMSIENADSLKDMIDALNADSLKDMIDALNADSSFARASVMLSWSTSPNSPGTCDSGTCGCSNRFYRPCWILLRGTKCSKA